MRTSKLISAITLISSFLMFLSFDAQLQVASAQTETDPENEVDDEEPTCSLDNSTEGDCSTAAAAEDMPSDYQSHDTIAIHRPDLTGRVISLSDETFDDLTLTSLPSTWLIMFKTNSCGICKKAMPAFEALSVDADIVGHNDRELATYTGRADEQQRGTMRKEEAEPADGGGIPAGPIYIATVDAGWSGRDTTKRFDVDATPTIIVLRSEGYADKSKIDSRSYYTFRGQRAIYPLRTFVLGGYASRKRINMPPPLSDAERKPRSYAGRLYDYYLSPGVKWAGGIIGRIVLAWFGFMGILGVFMRVHNYAWGSDDSDDADHQEKREREIESEKAQGRREYQPSTDEKTAKRQQIMWEKKEANRAKFATKLEATKATSDVCDEGDDDEMKGVGISVKKSDAKKVSDAEKKKS
ncbi:hypothetical protein ACHAW5_002355 [Stephanodiscus triporus]|uniref:Thioredoxin domain-containing protein n=1 Tax=Stephanodiscus triporus TaxID=2934178 RepID=A0ABD3R0M6_9STRA